MNRRELLRMGVRVGGAFLVSATGPLPRAFASDPQSPPTEPFLDPLPLPPLPQGGATPFPDLDPDAEPFLDRTGARGVARFFTIIAEERKVRFHKNLPETSIWGHRDAAVSKWDFVFGPTFRVTVNGNEVSGNIVRFVNNLPKDHVGFGVPRITTHLHGGHHPSRSDGFPENVEGLRTPSGRAFVPVIEPEGGHFDYTWPVVDPGALSGTGEIDARASTLWYHDHLLDFTGANVYRGLAGLFIVFEDPKSAFLADTARDTGDETNADGIKTALRLPSGNFDVPVVLQDKIFAPDGSLVYDPLNHDGFLGDKMLANGAIQPFHDVKRRKYRFRFLNASNARFYKVFLTDAGGAAYPMTIIATEGGLLSRPIRDVDSFLIAPAERIEVVIDFSNITKTNTLFFENRLIQDDGRGPRGTFEKPEVTHAGVRIVKLNLQEPVPDPSQVPDVLRPIPPLPDLRNARVRQFEFDRSHGAWTINGDVVDLHRPMASVRINSTEIWRFKNSSGGWWHPIHVHGEFCRVLSRNGVRPSPVLSERDDIARKDTVVLGPGSEVEVVFTFNDFPGPYVMHCHTIEHEDMFMMTRYDIVA